MSHPLGTLVAMRHLTPDRRADALAARQHGVVSFEQAIACGLTPERIRGRVASGRWLRLTRGVYAVAATPPSWQQTVMAACLAAPAAAVASHLTAAALHGLWRPPPRPHITVPRGFSVRLPIATVHRAALAPTDIVRIEGIACSSPARLLVECAALLAGPSLADLVDDVLCAGQATKPGVEAAMARGSRSPGRPGTRALRAALAIWTPDMRPGSRPEVRMVRRVVEWGFDRPELQWEVRLPSGQRFVLDAAWPGDMIGLEYDGRRAHGPRRIGPDEARHDALEQAGWRIGHVEKPDLLPSETRLRDWLRREFDRRRREVCA
ncbi:MAG: type IV toxin-antitoxin system AbiEi family antitoxin domain-containing protein [Acidimicrobiales bacterium]